jgi:hypothetical protein
MYIGYRYKLLNFEGSYDILKSYYNGSIPFV